MFFRNLTVFRLTEPGVADDALDQRLAAAAFRPCLSQEPRSSGWVAPLDGSPESLVHESGGARLVCLQTEERILPPAVLRDAVNQRAAEREAREDRRLRRGEKYQLRDELLLELLPRAFTQRRRNHACFDGTWLVVDGAGGRAVGELTDMLRKTLGSLPIAPPAVTDSPAAVMTGWLGDESLPAGLELGDECELRDAEGVVRCKGQDLRGEEIRTHLQAGKQVVRLALRWDERLEFLLDEDLTVRRLRFLDVVREPLDQIDAADAVALFDAEFSLMIGELRRFLPTLLAWFGGETQRV